MYKRALKLLPLIIALVICHPSYADTNWLEFDHGNAGKNQIGFIFNFSPPLSSTQSFSLKHGEEDILSITTNKISITRFKVDIRPHISWDDYVATITDMDGKIIKRRYESPPVVGEQFGPPRKSIGIPDQSDKPSRLRKLRASGKRIQALFETDMARVGHIKQIKFKTNDGLIDVKTSLFIGKRPVITIDTIEEVVDVVVSVKTD